MIHRNSMEPPVRRKKITVIYAVIAVIHCVLIFFPLWYWELRMPKQKVNLFRVKIGPSELSSGPVVGPPERARQSLSAPPEPEPEPEIAKPEPKPVAEPKIVPSKPKPKPVKEPKIVKKKVTPKKAVKEPQITKKKKVRKPVKNTPKKTAKKPVKPKRNSDEGVFQSDSTIMNPNTPVGNRNAAQTYAKKFDGKAPGGGADSDMALYGKNVERYIYFKWKQPPQSRIGDTRPETVVEFVVSPSGKVLSARIVTPSRNPAMEESVKALLATLDILPRPPYVPGQKNFEFQLVLKTK